MNKEKRNPFILGMPVRPPEFYGREKELHSMIEGIISGRSYLVYGDRRIGKTSLLLALRHYLAEDKEADSLVLVNAQAFNGVDQIVQGIIQGIASSSGRKLNSLKSTEVDNPFQILRTAIRYSKQKRIILLLDEAEMLFHGPNSNEGFLVASALRSLVSEGLLILVATAFSPTSLQSPTNMMVSPLFNVLITVHLDGFTMVETSGFARSRFSALGFTTTPSFEQRLFDLAGGYPYYIQMLCSHAYERIRSSEEPVQLTKKLFDNLDSMHIEHLISAKLGNMQPEEILILTTLADIENPASIEEICSRLSVHGSAIPPHVFSGILDDPNQIRKALSNLEMSYLVRKEGVLYNISHGLLRFYVQRYITQLPSEIWSDPDLRCRLSKDTIVRGDWVNIEVELSTNSLFSVEIIGIYSSADGKTEIEPIEPVRKEFQGRGNVSLRVRSSIVGSSTLEIEIRYSVFGKEHSASIRENIEFVVPTAEFVKLISPYVFGVPITDPDLFCGRIEMVSNIVETLRPPSGVGKRDIALVGRRRIGKTSILLRLRQEARENGFVPAFVNLEKVEPRTMGVLHAHFIEALTDALLTCGKKGWWLRSRLQLFRWRRQLRAMRFSIKGVGLELRQADPVEIKAFEQDISKILNFRRKFYPGSQYMVILIDEATLLATFESKHTLSYLRGIIQSEELQEISWIIAGSDLLYRLTSRESSPLYNLFLTLRVRALDSKTTGDLIRKPIEGQGVEFSQEAVDYISDVTGGIPYWIQAVCHYVIDLLNERRKRDVQLRDVRDAVQRVVQHQDLSLLEIWNELSEIERFLFCIVASEDRRPRANQLVILSSNLGVSLNETRVRDSMARLESIGIVAEEDNRFEIEDGILREWVRNKKRPEDLAEGALEELKPIVQETIGVQ